MNKKNYIKLILLAGLMIHSNINSMEQDTGNEYNNNFEYMQTEDKNITDNCYILDIPSEIHLNIIEQIIKDNIMHNWNYILDWKRTKARSNIKQDLSAIHLLCRYFREFFISHRSYIINSIINPLKEKRLNTIKLVYELNQPLLNNGKKQWQEMVNLIDNGADIDSQDKFGRTTLIQAAASNNTPVMESLIDRGANVNIKDLRGNTALTNIASKNQVSIVKLLIDKGAIFYTQSPCANDILSNIKKECHKDIIKLIKVISKGLISKTKDHEIYKKKKHSKLSLK